MFDKILIANRGEIAVRIIETCKRLGVETVAVFSESDARALHVRQAGEAAFLGPSPSELSYLAKDKIVEAALKHGCQAVHPGYGFLSENSEFAAMVAEAGLAFIGPAPDVIAKLGDKIASKNLALAAGVPVVPGHNQPVADPDEAARVAREVGFPILLKPAAGGGGRGMRIVHAPEELGAALKAGQEETRKAFGDDTLFVERFIVQPRHIEIQIMADNHGQVVYLAERECSIQRRYQKVIEEAPSMVLTPELRARMGEMACSLAREAGYSNAGTVEFILDRDHNFFFLEMNTRLQVEHPVTELITGLDLVEIQLKVAAGQPLGISQEDVTITGWSMEARICSEDPTRDFLPSTGLITRYAVPRGKDIRVDSGVGAGSLVSVHYDSMLSKVISYGADREEARKALVHGLNRYHLEGVTTNINFANAILNHPAFISGDLSTNFIEEHFEDGQVKQEPEMEKLHAMVIASTLVYHNRQNLVRESLKPMISRVGQAHSRVDGHYYMVKGQKNVFDVRLRGELGCRDWRLVIDGTAYEVRTPEFEFYRRRLKLKINGQYHYFRLQYQGNFIWTAFCGITRTFEIYDPMEWQLSQFMPEPKKRQRDNVLLSPMPGLVLEVLVEEGERVYKGQDLVIIESMKMASGVSSPRDGEVGKILVEAGQAVETDDVMIEFNGG